MHPLEKKIGTLLREKKILTPGEKVVVGVSAGPDSLCLLHVLHNLAPDFSLSLVVVYFDHGLRPEESVHESKFVADEARKMGWPFSHGAGDVADYARGNGVSIEDAARTLRYAYLKETLLQCDGHKIAVAHTADDQAEELMLRLLRGTGRKGLSGMQFLRDGVIVRPFLETSKDEIYAYLKDKNTSYLTDSSNLERIYLRNRVRLDLIPYLEKNFNPGIKNILRQTASIFQDEENLLADLSIKAYNGTVSGKDELRLNLALFKKQHVAIQRRIIEKMLLELGNSPGFRQIDRILCLASQGESKSRIHLSCGLRGIIKGGMFVFSYPQGRTQKRGDLRDSPADPLFNLDIMEPGLFRLYEGCQVEVSCLDRPPGKSELSAAGVDFFDMDMISFPFTIRNRKIGDRFHPLGSSGHKKVGEFLTDLKLDENIRRRLPVVEHEGEVAALLGLRLSHKYRIRNSTVRVLRIALLKK